MSAGATIPRGGRRVAFTVHGLPVPQGSKTAIVRGGRALVVEDARRNLNPWRGTIAATALRELDGALDGPVAVTLRFRLARPKAHFRTGRRAGELREDAPTYVANRPDVDKLARAVLDALTGIAFRDDGQVAYLAARKVYFDTVGVDVEVEEIA